MKTMKVFMPVILFFFISSGMAQTTKIKKERQEFQLESKFLNEKRVISIDLPADYASSKNSYPVLYLLDGRKHMQHAPAAVDYLSGNGNGPALLKFLHRGDTDPRDPRKLIDVLPSFF